MGRLAHRCAVGAHQGSRVLAVTLLVHRARHAECLGMFLVVVMVVEPAWQQTRGWRAVQEARFQGPRL